MIAGIQPVPVGVRIFHDEILSDAILSGVCPMIADFPPQLNSEVGSTTRERSFLR